VKNFSCIYCGKKLTAKEKYAGKKGICPACKHTIFIPKTDSSFQTSGPRGREKSYRRDPEYWKNKSDAQIAEELFKGQEEFYCDENERQRIFIRKILYFMIPTYDEITLFTFSFAFLFLLLISSSMREDTKTIISFKYDIRLTIAFFISLIGMVMSLFNIFFERVKYDFEKWLLLAFAVFVSGGTGFYAGRIMLQSSSGWQLIFPIWNIFNSLALLFLFRLRVISIQCVIDEKPKISYVVISMVSVIILLCLCNYTFRLHWAISYSVCICYTMSLLKAVHDVLGKTFSIYNQPA